MSERNASAPALLGLDWGTSTLRAFMMAPDGAVLAERSRPWGIARLPDGGYPAAVASICAGWPVAALPMIASGMVGSRDGWRETGYLALPRPLDGLAGALEQVRWFDGARERTLHLVPGLLDPSGPDVMRGEETEAVGALDALGRPAGPLLLVMPGTHSKWLRVEDGTLLGFRTFMTGELFAVLSRHSILAAAAAPGEAAPAAARERAFAEGVRAAAAEGLSRELFRTRALTLTGTLEPGLAADRLSGLLVGEELTRAGRERPQARIVLAGDPALLRRYADGFAALGREVPHRVGSPAARGLHRLALDSGLLSGRDAA